MPPVQASPAPVPSVPPALAPASPARMSPVPESSTEAFPAEVVPVPASPAVLEPSATAGPVVPPISAGPVRRFLLPDLGEGLVEAEIVRWLVAPGEPVEVDTPVVEVETAKTVVELPSPHRGRVAVLHGRPGDVVAVGAPLLSFHPPGGPDAAAPSSGPPGEPAMAGTDPAPSASAGGTGMTGTAPTLFIPAGDTGMTGALAHAPDPGPGPAAPGDAAPADGRAGGPVVRRRPLDGWRGAVARKVAAAHREIPAVTVWVDADATGLLAARRAVASDPGAPRPGLLALLSWFALDGLRRFPVLNGWVDPDREEIVESAAVHLGLVVQAGHGLDVPVLPDAHTLRAGELADAVRRTVEAARAGRGGHLREPGTFTVNNFGGFGVDGSTPIVNHPEVAMLAMGRVLERPWVVDGAVRPRAIVQLSLTFDHRVCDGDVAGGFLRHVADLVESGDLP
ncbi:dihydrolipoamide acetyltransferase family protein [Sphaerisporangium melleum]|nr:dihydrolipoamide acetyltransferase family protein [Sphaerisporangium melleum]